jgi:hypothetical protein
MPTLMGLSVSRILKRSLFSISVGMAFSRTRAVRPAIDLIQANSQHLHTKMFKKMISSAPILIKTLNDPQSTIPKYKLTEVTASTLADRNTTIKPAQTLEATSTAGTKKTHT